MAENRVPYIIDLTASDKNLKAMLSKLNWEDILGSSKGKSFKQVLTQDTEAAVKEVKTTLKGLNIDWSTILGEKELHQLEKIVAKALGGSRKELEAFASKGDTTGIQNTIKYVSALGDELKLLGSSFDAASLARGMGAFMKVLTPLSSKIEQLATEPAKVEAAFDRLFNSMSQGSERTVKVGQSFDTIGTAMNEMASETNDAVFKMEQSLKVIDGLFDKKYSIKFESDLEGQFNNIQKQIDKTDVEIEKLQDKLDGLSSSDSGYIDVRNKLVDQYQKIAKLSRKQMLVDQQYTLKNSKDKSLLDGYDLSGDIRDAKKAIEILLDNARKEIAKQPKSIGVASEGVNIPINIPSQADIVKKINEHIAKINQSKSINEIKVGFRQTLDDAANIIEDQTIRAYGQSDGDYDAKTSELVQKTKERFGKIATTIDEKLSGEQGSILEKTKEWRKKVLDQFKFKSGDFEFKFNDTLIDELQSLFDEYAIKINIDPNYLEEQIKTVLSNSGGTIGTGTAHIDANSMAAAVATGLRAALIGETINIAPTEYDSHIDNTSASFSDITDHVAKEMESSAKHLDLAEDYVKEVVNRLKAVAKYASKDTAGSKATKEMFRRLGGTYTELDDKGNPIKRDYIDLDKINTAAGVGNDAEIVSMIENAFLRQDEFGKLTGSTIIDELSKFKDSSSKTILAFLTSMREVFFMLQEDTQTVEEWIKKRDNREMLDSARSTAKATSVLRDVRSSIRTNEIPNIETIDTAISLMSAIGKSTDSLQTLKTAREALADNIDDKSINEFKIAAKSFYDSSKKTFWDLKKQAEDTFKGTVYFQGKNGKTYSQYYDNYSKLAKIKDDAVIVDVVVHSSLNSVALGEVKSKNNNRPSQAEEKRLMRNSSRLDFIVPREYEEDILNKKITYDGFKTKEAGQNSGNFNPERVAEVIKNLRAEAIELEKIGKLEEAQSKRSLADANEKRLQRYSVEQVYNQLLEESLILQGSINKAEQDGASESFLKKKRTELKKINAELTEIKTASQLLGGFLSQEGVKEYSDNERKIYALGELEKIENDLITATVQKRVSESRISKKDREIADLDKWGLGAGIGASEVAKTKGNLTYEFMSGDYVKSRINALREATKKAIDDYESKLAKEFDETVTNAMAFEGDYSGVNVEADVKRFLQTSSGQDIAKRFDKQRQQFYNAQWQQFNEDEEQLRNQLKTEFKGNLKTDNGVLTAVTKTQDEAGQWIDEIIEIRVKEALRARLEAEKKILEGKHEPIQGNIDRLESDKRMAIEYGGISDKELLSGEIIEDQIRKEEELVKWQEKRATIQASLTDLENSGIDKSDETYKEGKRKLKEAEQQVQWYDMLVKDRQKLAQMRYDESKEPTYTDEEKKLRFTNQIVTYNQKIEDSLVKQKALQEQIAVATGDEKTRLQRQLSIEEANVTNWREKIPTYVNKLNKLQTSQSQNTTDTLTLDGGIFGNITSLLKGAIDGANINIDTEELAKEITLKAILDLLSGVEIGNNASNHTIDIKDYESKIARISELEAKQSIVAETKKSKKLPVGVKTEAEARYKTWNITPTELQFDVVKKEAIELKQVIDTLYDEGKTDTIEFVDAQTKLSMLLSGWRNNIGKSSNPEVYGEKGKEAWMTYLTTNMFDNLNNVPLKRISKDNYISQVRGIYKGSQDDTSTTVQSNLTRKERKELNQLKAEVRDNSPTNNNKTNLVLSANGLATNDTLYEILTLLQRAFVQQEPKGASSGVPNKKPSETSEISVDSINPDINKYAEVIKNAQTDQYLMPDDANVTKFVNIKKSIDDIIESVNKGTPLTEDLKTKLEQLGRQAIDTGDVINKTIQQNKQLYIGTNEINSVNKQRDKIMGTFGADNINNNDTALVKNYQNAYEALHNTYNQFAKDRTLYDTNNQEQLRQQAAKVQLLGKKLIISMTQAEKLHQLVDQSGLYTDKIGIERDLGGVRADVTIDEFKDLEATMRNYVQNGLGQANIENVKFNNTTQQLTYTLRTSKNTVADMVVQYNEAENALFAYNKQERESLTGLKAFFKQIGQKTRSILQYTTSITSIYRVWSMLRQGITYIKEIDSALTELKKVTDETEETYDRFLQTAAKTADKVGSTIKDVVSSTADWARLNI